MTLFWPSIVAIHLLAAVTWIGGMVFLSSVLSPLLRSENVTAALFRSVAKRFRDPPRAWPAFAVRRLGGHGGGRHPGTVIREVWTADARPTARIRVGRRPTSHLPSIFSCSLTSSLLSSRVPYGENEVLRTGIRMSCEVHRPTALVPPGSNLRTTVFG